MKLRELTYSLVVIAVFFLFACKSEFEKARTSNDGQVIYNKAVEYYQQEDYSKSLDLIAIVLNTFRGKKEFEDLNYMLANANYQLGNYELASSYFKNFANGFINSHRREEAEFMSAYSLYKISPNYRLDQENSERAINSFQQFVNKFPNSPRIAECNKLMDGLRAKQEEKAYNAAVLYYNVKQYQAAIHSLENLLKDYPETKRGEEIRYMIIKSYYDYAANSIYDRQEERYDEVIDIAEEFIKKYKNGAYRKEIRALLSNSKKILNSFQNDRYKIESSRN